MPVMLVEVIFAAFIVWVGTTQIIGPILRDTPMFPILRNERRLERELARERQRQIERDLAREKQRLVDQDLQQELSELEQHEHQQSQKQRQRQ